jgi:hypothetical protein
MYIKNIVVVVSASAAILLAGIAKAGCGYISNRSGNWCDPKVWTVVYGGCSGTVPGANDVVVIAHNVEVNDSRSVQMLIINDNKTLHITSTGSLTMTGASPSGGQINGMLWITGSTFATASSGASVFVTGTILMNGDNPRLTLNRTDGIVLDSSDGGAVIVVDATSSAGPAYFSGSGSLSSDSSTNRICINLTQCDDEVQLRLDGARLSGAMTMESGGGGGKASFDNRGTVVANVNLDTFLLAGSLTLVTDTASSSCSTARWQTNSDGTLEFEISAWLSSSFLISHELVLDAPVTTSGSLLLESGGCIVPIDHNPFTYGGLCEGSCNPGNPVTTIFCCSE